MSASIFIDWCCFYYFTRNSLVALLEDLFARITSFANFVYPLGPKSLEMAGLFQNLSDEILQQFCPLTSLARWGCFLTFWTDSRRQFSQCFWPAFLVFRKMRFWSENRWQFFWPLTNTPRKSNFGHGFRKPFFRSTVSWNVWSMEVCSWNIWSKEVSVKTKTDRWNLLFWRLQLLGSHH